MDFRRLESKPDFKIFQRPILFLILISWPALAVSQENPPPTRSQDEAISNVVSLSGSIGIYGELYDKSSGVDRRPSSSARLFFKPTLSLYKSFSISTDMILSTEGSSNRQNINQIDFNPKWRWGNAHLGDFTDNYSSLTLHGIRIRGGGVSLNPGKFRFSTIVGQTRRATSNTSSARSFSRSLYGGRIGLGRNGGSFIDLIVLKSKDKASSLPTLEQSDGIDDTSEVQETANPWSQYPEDNLITAISSNWQLFDKKVAWGNEIAGSVYTRNTEGKLVTDKDIPSWVDKVFKVHVGSRVDLAYKTELNYVSRNWNLSSGYEFIGPGYISLGLSSLMSDRQAVRLSGTYRQKSWSITLNGARENDNLIDQKINTTVRQRLGGILNIKPVDWWNIIFTSNLLNMNNNAPNDTSLIDNTNTIFGINQTIIPGNHRKIQSVSLNYVMQRSSDSNPLREDSRLRSQSIDLRITVRASAHLAFTPATGVSVSKIGGAGSKTISSVNLNTLYKAMADKLTTSLTLGPTFSNESQTFKTILSAMYKFNRSDQLQTEIKINHFNDGGTERDYNESIWNLSVSHRF